MPGNNFKTLVLGLLLAGCTTTQTPGIKVEYVDRPVITETKCVKAADIPTKPDKLGSNAVPSNVERALSVSMAKNGEYSRYADKADFILRKCADK